MISSMPFVSAIEGGADMQVYFYNNASDSRKLNKSLSSLGSANCQLKEPCDILFPSVTLARGDLSGYAQCNYMYIPTFRRYYFVEVRALVGDMLEIKTIQSDPLMSYANAIRSIRTSIIRQEKIYNDYIVDGDLPIRATKNIQWVNIGTYNAGTGIYLTVDGGNS